jgi:DDE domain
MMDRKTRFLLASKVSEARDINGAVAVFKLSRNAHNNEPKEILTDSWRAYREGIAQNFKNGDHIPKCGIGKPHANNNRAERLNGTLRERTKVQRAWKKHTTPLAEGQRIQYNFVKPDQALDNHTPAEKAGGGGGDSSPKHDDNKKSGGGDKNDGFPSPATTDDTSIQQTCLDGLAPLTASAICGSSQTPTDNIPSSPTGDLVIAGNPPAGVNCVSPDECLTPSGGNVANSGAAGSSNTGTSSSGPTQTDNTGGGDGTTPTDTGATTGSTNQQQQQSVSAPVQEPQTDQTIPSTTSPEPTTVTAQQSPGIDDGYVLAGTRHTPEQEALKDLIKDITNGGRKPLSKGDAEALQDLARRVRYPGFRASPDDLATKDNHWKPDPTNQPEGQPHIHMPGVKKDSHIPVEPGTQVKFITLNNLAKAGAAATVIYLGYQLIKWGGAMLTAPATGGASLGAAAVTP